MPSPSENFESKEFLSAENHQSGTNVGKSHETKGEATSKEDAATFSVILFLEGAGELADAKTIEEGHRKQLNASDDEYERLKKAYALSEGIVPKTGGESSQIHRPTDPRDSDPRDSDPNIDAKTKQIPFKPGLKPSFDRYNAPQSQSPVFPARPIVRRHSHIPGEKAAAEASKALPKPEMGYNFWRDGENEGFVNVSMTELNKRVRREEEWVAHSMHKQRELFEKLEQAENQYANRASMTQSSTGADTVPFSYKDDVAKPLKSLTNTSIGLDPSTWQRLNQVQQMSEENHNLIKEREELISKVERLELESKRAYERAEHDHIKKSAEKLQGVGELRRKMVLDDPTASFYDVETGCVERWARGKFLCRKPLEQERELVVQLLLVRASLLLNLAPEEFPHENSPPRYHYRYDDDNGPESPQSAKNEPLTPAKTDHSPSDPNTPNETTQKGRIPENSRPQTPFHHPESHNLNPDPFEAHYHKILTLSTRALHHSKRLPSFPSLQARSYYYMGRAQHCLGHFEDALKSFRRTRKAENVFVKRSDVRERMAQVERAIERKDSPEEEDGEDVIEAEGTDLGLYSMQSSTVLSEASMPLTPEMSAQDLTPGEFEGQLERISSLGETPTYQRGYFTTSRGLSPYGRSSSKHRSRSSLLSSNPHHLPLSSHRGIGSEARAHQHKRTYSRTSSERTHSLNRSTGLRGLLAPPAPGKRATKKGDANSSSSVVGPTGGESDLSVDLETELSMAGESIGSGDEGQQDDKEKGGEDKEWKNFEKWSSKNESLQQTQGEELTDQEADDFNEASTAPPNFYLTRPSTDPSTEPTMLTSFGNVSRTADHLHRRPSSPPEDPAAIQQAALQNWRIGEESPSPGNKSTTITERQTEDIRDAPSLGKKVADWLDGEVEEETELNSKKAEKEEDSSEKTKENTARNKKTKETDEENTEPVSKEAGALADGLLLSQEKDEIDTLQIAGMKDTKLLLLG
ncbi:MAG: hypothetical protein M1831_006594 [Alyxoria varia]|nr:MAG: hypothetical protein M1831_006594 [Alyxoria varia]